MVDVPVSCSSTWSKSLGLRARSASRTRSSRCVSSSASPVMGVDAVSSMVVCILTRIKNQMKFDGIGREENTQNVRLCCCYLKTRDPRCKAASSRQLMGESAESCEGHSLTACSFGGGAWNRQGSEWVTAGAAQCSAVLWVIADLQSPAKFLEALMPFAPEFNTNHCHHHLHHHLHLHLRHTLNTTPGRRHRPPPVRDTTSMR